MTATAETEARFFAITRPAPALMKVYLVHAFGRAGALLGVLAVIALRFVDFSRVKAVVTTNPTFVGGALGAAYVAAYVAVVIGLLIRYKTLRYRFDEHGVGQSSGLFFRSETFVAYARIQDIQISRSIFEKAFGLGTIEIQTASGSGGAEATLDGLVDFELVAEYLRERLRGRRAGAGVAASRARDPLALLDSIKDEVRGLREAVVARAAARRRSS